MAAANNEEEMAVSVSMALSELAREDFPQHENLYQQGEEIVNQQLTAPSPPPPVAPRSRSSSNNSSRNPSPSRQSEAGKEGKPKSQSITEAFPQWYPSQLSLRDFCMFRIDMAESSVPEKMKMLQVYDDAVKNAKPKESKQETEKEKTEKVDEEPPFNGVMKIKWGDRNLLDLGENIRAGWGMTPQQQPQQSRISCYFGNSSQAPVDGASCSRYCINRCKCKFEEPVYY
ncbi:hypothetical protein ILUMI_06107 [Ignelater luminosus]|uniref:Uncharacterized protein n=1 Tax=Ignelater luminosus TaxID=2038154 RepID=A0A8K0D962_IGNLU|nr:hypothetical protein ILUMI_06107 [Ignelater luminosus]